MEIETILKQLTYTYNHINSYLWCDISASDESITISAFIQHLKLKKNVWYEVYRSFNTLTAEERNDWDYIYNDYNNCSDRLECDDRKDNNF